MIDTVRLSEQGKNFIEKEKRLSRVRLLNWCMWKVALPLGVIIILYPIYRYVLELHHPFEQAFAHGDLLLFSVLILLEAAVEGEHITRQGLVFQAGIGAAKLFAIFFIFIFGFLKFDLMLHEKGRMAGSLIPAISELKLLYYSYFNCVVAIGSVLYSLFAFYTVTAKEIEERLREMAGG